MFAALRDEIRTQAAAADAGETLDPAGTSALLERVRGAVALLERSEVSALRDELDAWTTSARTAREQVVAELARIRAGRQALKGYSGLRGHHKGQRVYKRA